MNPETRNVQQHYCGRFAPSPTGPLHFGSLVAAVGSYVDARHHQGTWIVRMEDLDPPREVPGAANQIINVLESLGMASDKPVFYQSQQGKAYEDALASLQDRNLLYPCGCTRKEIADSSTGSNHATIYPGTCRNGLPPGRQARSLRLRVNQASIHFDDILQGMVSQQLATEVGDFMVRRADRLIAYQLAVVVDDAAQGITHIVRGADLLDSTPRQIYLQQLLDLPIPAHLHLPVAVNAEQAKLSKQTFAEAISGKDKNRIILDALNFLGQDAPKSLGNSSLDDLWAWAFDHWRRESIPAIQILLAPTTYL